MHVIRHGARFLDRTAEQISGNKSSRRRRRKQSWRDYRPRSV